jgi:hypothetical protein
MHRDVSSFRQKRGNVFISPKVTRSLWLMTLKGLHIKTREQSLAEAQAYFAKLAPANVSLSKEILKDRRSESERD